MTKNHYHRGKFEISSYRIPFSHKICLVFYHQNDPTYPVKNHDLPQLLTIKLNKKCHVLSQQLTIQPTKKGHILPQTTFPIYHLTDDPPYPAKNAESCLRSGRSSVDSEVAALRGCNPSLGTSIENCAAEKNVKIS